MKPAAVLHVIEGRIRVKLPDVKHSPETAREVERRIQGLAGIDSVSANPVTGSVIVLYNARETKAQEVMDALRDWGYVRDDLLAGHRLGSNEGLAGLVLRATTEAALQTLITALI